MKRLLIAITLLACVCMPVKAQQAGSPEAVSAARELLAVLGPDMNRQISTGMIAQMWPRLQNQWAGKVDAETLAELKSEIEKSLTKFLDDVMKDAPALYAKYFTATELRDIAAFYRTPTGMKALQVLPKIAPEVMNLVMPRAPEFERQLVVTIEAVLRKRGYQK